MTASRTISILLALLLTIDASAQTQASVVAPKSRLWIEGRSTVNEFECDAGRIDGRATLDGGRSAAEVLIPVDTFDCGKSRMNKDLYEALKADRHPRIEFELEHAKVVSRSGSDFALDVRGRLTIAGVTREITVASVGRRLPNGQYRISGRMPLSMYDFGIEPPTALAGLIRAHDRIVVGFDLVAAIETGHAGAADVCGSGLVALC